MFNNIHSFEHLKVHTYESNIWIIRPFGVLLNYAEPQKLISKSKSIMVYVQTGMVLICAVHESKLYSSFFFKITEFTAY